MEKRYRLEAKLVFYTSKKEAKEAKLALRSLENAINNALLTKDTEVVKIDIRKVEKLPF